MWAVSKYEFSLLRRLSIVTVLAFAAQRHAFVIDQYLLHTGRTAANPSTAVAVVDGWKRKTDGQTDAEAFRRPCSAYADSVNKTALSEKRSGRMIFYRAIPCVPQIAATRRHMLKLKYT